jgi:hypothetical protein
VITSRAATDRARGPPGCSSGRGEVTRRGRCMPRLAQGLLGRAAPVGLAASSRGLDLARAFAQAPHGAGRRHQPREIQWLVFVATRPSGASASSPACCAPRRAHRPRPRGSPPACAGRSAVDREGRTSRAATAAVTRCLPVSASRAERAAGRDGQAAAAAACACGHVRLSRGSRHKMICECL